MIKLIRASPIRTQARAGLIEKFELSAEQAQAILDMRLQRLTALETDKIKPEHADLMERIKELRAILGEEERLYGLIKEELLEIRRDLRRRAPHARSSPPRARSTSRT